jgi:hypothetical protein
VSCLKAIFGAKFFPENFFFKKKVPVRFCQQSGAKILRPKTRKMGSPEKKSVKQFPPPIKKINSSFHKFCGNRNVSLHKRIF